MSPPPQTSLQDGLPPRLPSWAPAVAIFLLVFIAYIPIWRAGFAWDDDSYLTDNLNLRDWDGLVRTWADREANPQYYPLVFTTFWLEQRLWGLHPLGYHVINLLLHAGGAVLLWRILRRLNLPCAWWVAAIFAVHPVHVESVAWITERKNTLSALLYMTAALAYLRFAGWPTHSWVGSRLSAPDSADGANREPIAEAMGHPTGAGSDGASPFPRAWYYAAAILAFAAALAAKSVTATLPIALAIILWWRGNLNRRHILCLLPMLALGALAGVNTRDIEINHVGASGPAWDFSFADRCLIAGRALWFYAGKLFWPVKLTFSYPRWHIDAHSSWQYLWPLGVATALAMLWAARRRIGRGPLAAVLLFIVTLAPALGFSSTYPMRYSLVADHFQYLASIGLIALGVSATSRAIPSPKALAVAGTALLAILSVLTWRQAAIYTTPETLWLDTIAKNPASMMANDNLAVHLFTRGEYDRALPYHRRALELEPQNPRLHLNLAKTLSELGQAEAAETEMQAALRVDPRYAPAYVQLGNMRLAQNRLGEAHTCFAKAVEAAPSNALAHNGLGLVLVRLNRPREAQAQFLAALKLRPDLAEAHNNAGILYEAQGRFDQAMASYNEALRLKPDFQQARRNRDRVAARAGGR